MPTIKTRRKMGWILITFHWFMILMTVGLWTPVYLSARRRRVTVTQVPAGYAGPIPGQPYAPQPYGHQPHGQYPPR
ncbi:hypothetical protein [Streptomyces sp. NPDC058335]|uniref:hypothetical protein n=1 Tax=Streptomyces sp. NPDC058335 TaxID=3346451 RepID=UPI0036471A3C